MLGNINQQTFGQPILGQSVINADALNIEDFLNTIPTVYGPANFIRQLYNGNSTFYINPAFINTLPVPVSQLDSTASGFLIFGSGPLFQPNVRPEVFADISDATALLQQVQALGSLGSANNILQTNSAATALQWASIPSILGSFLSTLSGQTEILQSQVQSNGSLSGREFFTATSGTNSYSQITFPDISDASPQLIFLQGTSGTNGQLFQSTGSGATWANQSGLAIGFSQLTGVPQILQNLDTLGTPLFSGYFLLSSGGGQFQYAQKVQPTTQINWANPIVPLIDLDGYVPISGIETNGSGGQQQFLVSTGSSSNAYHTLTYTDVTSIPAVVTSLVSAGFGSVSGYILTTDGSANVSWQASAALATLPITGLTGTAKAFVITSALGVGSTLTDSSSAVVGFSSSGVPTTITNVVPFIASGGLALTQLASIGNNNFAISSSAGVLTGLSGTSVLAGFSSFGVPTTLNVVIEFIPTNSLFLNQLVSGTYPAFYVSQTYSGSNVEPYPSSAPSADYIPYGHYISGTNSNIASISGSSKLPFFNGSGTVSLFDWSSSTTSQLVYTTSGGTGALFAAPCGSGTTSAQWCDTCTDRTGSPSFVNGTSQFIYNQVNQLAAANTVTPAYRTAAVQSSIAGIDLNGTQTDTTSTTKSFFGTNTSNGALEMLCGGGTAAALAFITVTGDNAFTSTSGLTARASVSSSTSWGWSASCDKRIKTELYVDVQTYDIIDDYAKMKVRRYHYNDDPTKRVIEGFYLQDFQGTRFENVVAVCSDCSDDSQGCEIPDKLFVNNVALAGHQHHMNVSVAKKLLDIQQRLSVIEKQLFK